MFGSYKILLLSTLFSLVWFSAYSQGRDLQFGALFQGAPRLSASGKIENCAFSVSKGGQAKVCNAQTGTTLAADLEKEHKELRKSLKNFTIYPVASVSIFYRF